MSQVRTSHHRLDIVLAEGLGNRLQALISLAVLCTTHGLQLRLWWESSRACAADYEDLFEIPRIPGLELVGGRPPGGGTAIRIHTGGQLLAAANSRFEGLLDACGLVGADLMPSPEFRRGLEAFAGRIRIHPEVQALSGSGVCGVGMHLRSSDHFPSSFASPDWLFREFLGHLSSADRPPVLICADNPERLQRLVAAYGAGAVPPPSARHPSLVGCRDSLEGIRMAFADLLALSRCSIIVGSHFSSFAQTAAIFGGRPLHGIALFPGAGRRLVTALIWRLVGWHVTRGDGLGDPWVALQRPSRSRWAPCAVWLANQLTRPAASTFLKVLFAPYWTARIERVASRIPANPATEL